MVRILVLSLLIINFVITISQEIVNNSPELQKKEQEIIHPDEFYVEKALEAWEKDKGSDEKTNFYNGIIVDKVVKGLSNSITVILYPTIDGIKIEGVRLALHFRFDGTICDRNGFFIDGVEGANTTASITKEKAIELALASTEKPKPGKPIPSALEAELLITKIDEKFVLVWKIPLLDVPPEGYGYYFYVDANSGSIIKKQLATIIDKRR